MRAEITPRRWQKQGNNGQISTRAWQAGRPRCAWSHVLLPLTFGGAWCGCPHNSRTPQGKPCLAANRGAGGRFRQPRAVRPQNPALTGGLRLYKQCALPCLCTLLGAHRGCCRSHLPRIPAGLRRRTGWGCPVGCTSCPSPSAWKRQGGGGRSRRFCRHHGTMSQQSHCSKSV